MDKILKEKIIHETQKINKLFENGKPLLEICKVKEPDFIEASAAGAFLQSFYNGIEGVLIMIYKANNETIPDGFNVHKLLFEKAFESNDLRAQILNNTIKEQFTEYLTFRHFFRHS